MTHVAESSTTHAVVDALREYRAADAEMQRRTRAQTSMSENEMRIVQFLIRQKHEDRAVKPSDIARHLGITSASMTALLDRLEKGGDVERVRHPTDRRSILVTVTEHAENLLRSTLLAFEEDCARVASSLSEEESSVVVRYLRELARAADAISPARA